MGYVVTFGGTGGAAAPNLASIAAVGQGHVFKLRVKGDSLKSVANGTYAILSVDDGTYAGRKLYVQYTKATGVNSNFRVWWAASAGGNLASAVFDASTLVSTDYYTLFMQKNDSFSSGTKRELTLVNDAGVEFSTIVNNTNQGSIGTTALTGRIRICEAPTGAPNAAFPGTIDGMGYYIFSGNTGIVGAARYAMPTAADAGIVSGVMFDEGSGTTAANLVSGAGNFTLTSPTWVAGGTWNASAPVPTQIAKNAGDGQSAAVGTAVAIAPSVIVKDASNNPVAGVSVTFAVASGGGSLGGSGTVVTNASGIATAPAWTLGASVGTNTLSATSTGLTGSPLTFTATATAGAATTIATGFGNNQSAPVNSTLPTQPSVLVTDAGGNPKSGVTVTWTVMTGGGSVSAGTSVTDASGLASIIWTLGSLPGSQTLQGAATGLAGSPRTFTATATVVLAAFSYRRRR